MEFVPLKNLNNVSTGVGSVLHLPVGIDRDEYCIHS